MKNSNKYVKLLDKLQGVIEKYPNAISGAYESATVEQKNQWRLRNEEMHNLIKRNYQHPKYSLSVEFDVGLTLVVSSGTESVSSFLTSEEKELIHENGELFLGRLGTTVYGYDTDINEEVILGTPDWEDGSLAEQFADILKLDDLVLKIGGKL